MWTQCIQHTTCANRVYLHCCWEPNSILGICHEPYLALLHESLVHELPERDSSCKVPQNILIYCVQPSLGLVLSAYHQAVFPTDGFFDELDRRGRERSELLYVCG